MILLFFYSVIFGTCFFSYREIYFHKEKKLEPCLTWAKSNGYAIPKKPSLIEFFLVDGNFHWLIFPFGLLLFILPTSRKVRFYKKEINILMAKWNYWIANDNSDKYKNFKRPKNKDKPIDHELAYYKELFERASKKVKPPKKRKKPTEPELTNYKELFERANKKVSEADTEGAIIDYTKAIKYKPEEGSLFRFRGLAKKELGDIHAACKDWLVAFMLGDKESKNLLEKHPKVLCDIYRSQGHTKRGLGDIKGAIKDWNEAVLLGDNEALKLIKKYSDELSNDKNKNDIGDPWAMD